ncbi:MAG: MBL fold metallo-hydrolase [Deltaproteobacteria bacterium]|jgi:metallo-beta-lactamase family protein|nr:MBL fold metallo-hydrolase [Deltaproteobacteria bacterium]
MKIKCLGAIRTVTGSCYQLENPQGGYTLIDCGIFQGGRQTELRNFNTALYKPAETKAIVITHAHMDHSGLVPRLVKAGYSGPIYATEATRDLLPILWQDAAHIQELEAQWKSRKNSRQGAKAVEPLYREEDAEAAAKLLRPLKLDREEGILPGLTVTCLTAGHILGAASLRLAVGEDGGTKTVTFSGDIGRVGQLLIKDPEIPPPSDVIFMETTYGNRLHKDLGNTIDELVGIINQAYREGGKIIIPTFAVERTQELLVLLAQAWHENKIPRDIPIILDSPLAISASEVYLAHPELYDAETVELARLGHGPMSVGTLRVTRTGEESQKINSINGPAIIMAGSGMANAGRVLHHFKHNLWRPNCHVIFVGFQAQGTTGRRLVEGAKSVKIFREEVLAKAKIHTLGGFSGHADQSELLTWLAPQIHPNLLVVLTHGEESGTLAFQAKLAELHPELNTLVPRWLDVLDVPSQPMALPVALPAAVRPALAETALTETSLAESWLPEAESFGRRLGRLRDGLAGRQEPLSPEKLALLEDLLSRAEEIALSR